LVLAMEDVRTQYPLLRVTPVDPEPLRDLLPTIPGLKLMLLNASHGAPRVRGAYCDFAMLESPYAVQNLTQAVGEDHVVFGSHSPLFYFSSAAFKLKESGFGERQARAIAESNARRFSS